MSSEVWEHFLIDLNDSSFAKCNFCSARISRGGKSSTTSALKKHLKRHSLAILRHNEMKLDARSEPLSPIEVVCVDDPPPSACSSSSSNAVHSPSPSPLQRPSSSATPFFKASKRVKTSPAVTNQPTLSKFIDSKEKFKPGDKRAETITKLIAEMICLDNQPFVIVENKGFRALINHLESRYVMPSRKVIANEIIPRMYAKTYATVKKLIADAEAISFTTDLWTSTANDDYMGLTAHFIDSKFVLRHICLDVMPFPYASHSAENIKQFICETLESWDITENVVAFVRDNGRNVVAALNASGFEHIPCLAHTLQLVIKYGLLNTSELNSLLPTCRKVVGHFKHSSHSTKILKAAQVTVGAKMHRLVQDEPTRWNSTLHMLKRLLEQRQAITLAASDLHVPAELFSSDWEKIHRVVDILKIFDQATFAVSNPNVSASEIIPIVNSLKEEMRQPEESSMIKNMKDDLLSSLESRYPDVEGVQIYAIATLLDPRLKASVFTNDDNVKKCKDNLIAEMKTLRISIISTGLTKNSTDVPNSSTKSTHGMWSFYSNIKRTPAPSEEQAMPVESEVEAYLKDELLKPEMDVMEFWKFNSTRFPRLHKLAKKYLSIPPATVFSERLFSTAGLICDKKRNRLDPDRLKMLVFLNKNLELSK